MPAEFPLPPHREIVPDATSRPYGHSGAKTVVYFIEIPAVD